MFARDVKIGGVVVALQGCCSRFAVLTCLISPLLMAPQAQAAGDAAAGKATYGLCATCHGSKGEGNQALNAPRLAGQEPWYIERQLKLYRDGARGTQPGDMPGMQMRPMAMAVADPTAITNLIAYIQTLPVTAPTPTVTGDVAAGKTAYAICAACHGQKAEGAENMGGPKLAGQDDWYLVRQIQNYKNNLRGYHSADIFGAQMKPMAGVLATDKAVADVVAYINSLVPAAE